MAAREVILYFDDQSDALRFALAAGSVMSGESKAPEQLVLETQRASRVKLGHAVSSQKTVSAGETTGRQ
jgi:hypothetical protein